MTESDINEAFQKAKNEKSFKHLDISKHVRYMLNKKEVTIAKKLEILWMLGKLELKNEPISQT